GVSGLLKHACPGVHRPMAEADGLLARVRVPGGRLSIAQFEGLGEAAATSGSGVIELTSRAHVQLRGGAEGTHASLVADLIELGLVHPDAEVDGRRNVLGAPATGWDPTEVIDVGPLVEEVERRLVELHGSIHPKAGVLVDAGGAVSLRGRRADVGLGAVRRGDDDEVVYELRAASGLPTAWAPAEPVPTVAATHAAPAAIALLTPHRAVPPPTGAPRPDGTPPAAVAARVRWIGPGGLERAPAATTTPPLGVHSRPGRGAFVGAAPLLGRLDPTLVAAIGHAVGHHAAS